MKLVALINVIGDGKVIKAGEEVIPDAVAPNGDGRPRLTRASIKGLLADKHIAYFNTVEEGAAAAEARQDAANARQRAMSGATITS